MRAISICRKTAGGGGYAINIMGDAATLKVSGAKNVAVYRARIKGEGAKRGSRGTLSHARRNFCARCASALWVCDPQWPEWVYPFASAIDTPLPKPKQDIELMLDYAAPWADIPKGRAHRFREIPRSSGAHKNTVGSRDRRFLPARARPMVRSEKRNYRDRAGSFSGRTRWPTRSLPSQRVSNPALGTKSSADRRTVDVPGHSGTRGDGHPTMNAPRIGQKGVAKEMGFPPTA